MQKVTQVGGGWKNGTIGVISRGAALTKPGSAGRTTAKSGQPRVQQFRAGAEWHLHEVRDLRVLLIIPTAVVTPPSLERRAKYFP
jgi:hypothetical protein